MAEYQDLCQRFWNSPVYLRARANGYTLTTEGNEWVGRMIRKIFNCWMDR